MALTDNTDDQIYDRELSEPLEDTTVDSTLDDSLTDDKVETEHTHGAPPKTLRTDNYLDDDEEFLKAEDTIISESETLSLFAQDENLISWKIINLLDEYGELRKKRELRADPPILQIKSSNEDFVEFLLTKEFTKTLNTSLSRVEQSFYGVDSLKKEKVTFKERINKIVTWGQENPFKAVFAAAFTILIIAAIFVF